MSKEEQASEEINREKEKDPTHEESGSGNGAEEANVNEPTDEGGEGVHEFGEAETLSPIEELQAQLKDEKERYLRLYAEFENFRRRNARERIELIQSASTELMKALLPVLDDFERARQSNVSAEDIASVKEGFDLLHQKLNSILTAKGLEVIEAMDEEFNPEMHEAIARIEAGKEKKGKIIDVVERGYKLNDKIIRHPKVVVGS